MERCRRSWILIILLLAATPSSARQTDALLDHPMLLTDRGSVDLLEEVRRTIMFMQFARAESLLDRLNNRPDGAVAAAYYKATIGLLEVLLFDTEESDELFLERSDELLELLAKQEPSISRSWLRADAIQQRMWAWAKNGRYVRAAFAGNAAFLAFESVLEEDPTFYEAYKGIGLLHMAIGALPKTYQTFLKFLGYSGGLDRGIAELRLSADSSQYSREEALVFLATLDVYGLSSAVEAISVLDGLRREYPGSPLFGLAYGDALIRKMRSPEAETVLREVVRFTAETGAVEIDYVHFFLGESLYRQNRFEEAREWFESFLEKHAGRALKVRARLHIGECLEMEGNREDALAWYEITIAVRDMEEELVAARRAGNLLGRPMDAADKALLRGHNSFNSGNLEAALPEFERVYEEDLATETQKGEAAYRLARLAHVSGDLEEAEIWYRRSIEKPGDPQAKWAPWGLFHLAHIAVKENRKEDARDLLGRLSDYDSKYDYQPTLERKARLMLDRLNAQSR